MTKIDAVGRKFGRLTVLAFAERAASGQTRYLCRCDCGTEKKIQAQNVRDGNTNSCGCVRKEVTAERGRSKKTHGMKKSPEYRVWAGMKNRATVSNVKNARYAGRGIGICDRWRLFENFYADMGPRPSAAHSIERIDVDGDYEPENCRWATHREQCRNTSYNVTYEFEGRTLCLVDWAAERNINPITLYWRFKQGWRGEKLFRLAHTTLQGAEALE